MQYAALTYNTFAMSVLSFICQLESPPPELLTSEKIALRNAARGPGECATPSDLWFLREDFFQARSFRSLEIMTWASQVRVAPKENAAYGGLRIMARSKELQHMVMNTDFIDRRMVWRGWYDRSHVATLAAALIRFEDQVARVSSLSIEPQAQRQAKRPLQSAAAKAIIAARNPRSEERVRHKLERWSLQGLPGPNARRTLRRLRSLAQLVAPRVSAACFSTIWNRWTTARRFQQRATADNRCVLGCPAAAEDSIEHYIRCRAVHEFGRACLRLEHNCAAHPEVFLMASDSRRWNQGSDLTRLALLIYCTYRATNIARSKGRFEAHDAQELLRQMLKEGVRDHPASAGIISELWIAR